MGSSTALLVCGIAVAASFLAVALIKRIALRKGIMDVPNARSSHDQPTPRGGGLAIVAVVGLGTGFLAWNSTISQNVALALLLSGTLVAATGYLDDLRGLSASWRLVAHFLASICAVMLINGWGLQFAASPLLWLLVQISIVFGIVWCINLFNFMDGIDGIAGSQAIFMGLSGAWIMSQSASEQGMAMTALVIASACAGFLLWNWPPAKIFLGDVGSGYLGFVIAFLAVTSSRTNAMTLFVWLILGGTFVVDASTTLIRRLLRRERFYEAHRDHAYQWLARRHRSHAQVTLLYLGVDILWLLPMAWLCSRNVESGAWIAAVALVPLVLLAVNAGAGKSENPGVGA
jgi:Fuc2NAc and GlcNAc transferase